MLIVELKTQQCVSFVSKPLDRTSPGKSLKLSYILFQPLNWHKNMGMVLIVSYTETQQESEQLYSL